MPNQLNNKLIDLNALSEYKDCADLKYQDKITAGNCISLNSNVISVVPTYTEVSLTSPQTIASGSTKSLGNLTFAPGKYILSYTCIIAKNATGYRQCSFALTSGGNDNFGAAYIDRRQAVNGADSTVRVFEMFEVSANDYPDGRKFYFNVRQNSGTSLKVYPCCHYIKF